jgi:hypothetical protein
MAIAAVTMATTAAQTVVDNALTRRGLTQEHAQEAPALETRNFFWRGQFAGFIVSGQFSYDKADIPPNGIIREEHLLALDVSFFDPHGTHLRTYKENHVQPVDASGKPCVNFAFDTISQELLQDGTFNVDDDDNRYRNGFVLGEGDPSKRKDNGAQSGLAFWSRPADNKTPHLHVDDWNNASGAGEFGYPIGYSSHEDASFAYATTNDKIAGGKVGTAYYEAAEDGTVITNTLPSDVDAYGQGVRVVRALAPSSVETRNFFWRGQFAGFIVSGQFSYDKADIPPNGIIREEHLLALDVSFFDPHGTHLRTYKENHVQPVDASGKPCVNFAFDTISQELLQDGTFNVDDDDNRYRNGFVLGEGDPSKRKDNGAQSGLAFWSRPADNKTPHLHVDDWNNASGAGEFGYPIGYSSHEDASFAYATTNDKIAGGKVGTAYYEAAEDGTVITNTLPSDVDAYGQGVRVTARASSPCPAGCIPSRLPSRRRLLFASTPTICPADCMPAP